MKKHELLKHAYDNYPKGTKFIQNGHSMVHVASGNYDVNGVTVYDVELDVALYIYYDEHEKWAEIVSDRKPLLISEDGVELFDKDPIFIAKFRVKWYLESHTDDDQYQEQFELVDNGRFISTDTEKYFSTKEAAIEWIESQNPKYKTVKTYFGLEARIMDNSEIHIYKENDFYIKLSYGDIHDIKSFLTD